MSLVINFQRRSLIVADDRMERTLRLADKASKTSVPVLLCGPSGTGKELIARYIHEKSARVDAPFVSVNCAAIPEGLLEAELFGYERGAFTGATERRIGKFEQAAGGTFLLDELSEMPWHLQAKLLRVLQEGEMDRLGGRSPIAVKCRIIATTNREPVELVQTGKFREDLFFRLNVWRIDCAPLKGRSRAISRLVDYFLDVGAQANGFAKAPELTAEAMATLHTYAWPGNIRELRNAIERALLLSDGSMIGNEHLDNLFDLRPASSQGSLATMEREMIEVTLSQTGGNREKAANKLGITARTLRNKLKQYAE